MNYESRVEEQKRGNMQELTVILAELKTRRSEILNLRLSSTSESESDGDPGR